MEGQQQPPAGSTGWWQASDGLWYPPEAKPPPAPTTQAPTTAQPIAPRVSNGMATAALVLGIIGLLAGLIPLFFFIAIPLGVLGLILGILGRRRAKPDSGIPGRGAALAGAILGAIAIVLGIIGVAIVNDAFSDVEEVFDDFGGEASDDDYDLTAECGTDEFGDVLPAGEITNTSDEVRGFQISVEILDGETKVDDTSTFVEDLDPGQTGTWEAFTAADAGSSVTCDFSVQNWGSE